MTKKEILKHIRSYKTPNSRIGYLNDILRKKGLLSEETQRSAYEILGDLYLKVAETMPIDRRVVYSSGFKSC